MIYKLILQFKYGMLRKIYRQVYKLKNRSKAAYIPVLAFHWFLSDEEKNAEGYKDNVWYASIENFEKQLNWLKEHGYYTLTCDQLNEWIGGKTELSGKPVLLTFDDGELSQLNLVMPLLKKYGYHGIFFVIGKHFAGDEKATVPADASEDAVTYFTKEQYCESDARSGAEIESHTYNLHYMLQGRAAARMISDEELRSDLNQMQQLSFDYIAMPYGRYGRNTASVLHEYYKLGFAIDRMGNPYATRKSNPYKINRIRVDGCADGDYLNRYLY